MVVSRTAALLQLPLTECENDPASNDVPPLIVTLPPKFIAVAAATATFPARVKLPLIVVTPASTGEPDPERVRWW